MLQHVSVVVVLFSNGGPNQFGACSALLRLTLTMFDSNKLITPAVQVESSYLGRTHPTRQGMLLLICFSQSNINTDYANNWFCAPTHQ